MVRMPKTVLTFLKLKAVLKLNFTSSKFLKGTPFILKFISRTFSVNADTNMIAYF